jgi:hypothetical protein
MIAAIYCPQIKRADRVADESRSVKETTAHAGESFHDSGRNRHAGLVSFCLSERLFSGRTSSQNHLRENPSLFRGEPMDEAALHVENLREALRQTQRHIVTAIGASASLLLGARHRQCQRGRDDDSSTWCWRSFIRDRDLSLGDLIALGIGDQFETLALRIEDPNRTSHLAGS